MPALLTVHPHPDDESIACGGVLARAVDAGAAVKVVTCTHGEAGDNLAGIDLDGEDLTSHRRRELRDALEALGVRDHDYLGYRDSGMAGDRANDHPDSFHRADLYEAAARLARIVRRFRPDVVVSDDADGTYGHPDHVKAFRVTERAVALAADPWWDTPGDGGPWEVAKRYAVTLPRSRVLRAHRRLREAGIASPFGEEPLAGTDDVPFGTPDELVTTTVDIRPWLARKRRAMAAHRSQIGPDSFFLDVPGDLVEELFGSESFVLRSGPVRDRPVVDGPEADLFTGLPT